MKRKKLHIIGQLAAQLAALLGLSCLLVCTILSLLTWKIKLLKLKKNYYVASKTTHEVGRITSCGNGHFKFLNSRWPL